MFYKNQMHFQNQLARCDYMESSKKFRNIFKSRISILQDLTNRLVLKFSKYSSKKLMERVHKANGLRKNNFDRIKVLNWNFCLIRMIFCDLGHVLLE